MKQQYNYKRLMGGAYIIGNTALPPNLTDASDEHHFINQF
jgi:hypothetical protein